MRAPAFAVTRYVGRPRKDAATNLPRLIALPDSRGDIYNLPAFPVPNIPRAKKLPLNDNIHRQLRSVGRSLMFQHIATVKPATVYSLSETLIFFQVLSKDEDWSG